MIRICYSKRILRHIPTEKKKGKREKGKKGKREKGKGKKGKREKRGKGEKGKREKEAPSPLSSLKTRPKVQSPSLSLPLPPSPSLSPSLSPLPLSLSLSLYLSLSISLISDPCRLFLSSAPLRSSIQAPGGADSQDLRSPISRSRAASAGSVSSGTLPWAQKKITYTEKCVGECRNITNFLLICP